MSDKPIPDIIFEATIPGVDGLMVNPSGLTYADLPSVKNRKGNSVELTGIEGASPQEAVGQPELNSRAVSRNKGS